MSGHVVLIGLSGSGKSAVGALLAERLGVPLYDTDAAIALQAGVPVPELLRRDAAQFRALEEEIVLSACRAAPGVIATGGGAVLSARSRAALTGGNTVVWLHAPAAVLARRLRGGEHRPLLAGDPVASLETLESERRSLYKACATLEIDTSCLSAAQVVDAIVERIPPGSGQSGATASARPAENALTTREIENDGAGYDHGDNAVGGE